jgi:tetratricopeptide (TPR) repeat protein
MASPINNPGPADAAGAGLRITGPALWLAAILAVVVVALTALDRFLAATESAEVQSSARNAYLAGSRLLQAGKANEAVESLRTAHALVRENIDYELALVTALMDAGQTAEADPLMDDALQREPNDGQTNLIAARLAAKKGNAEQAGSWYHRAIYGEWPDSAASRRRLAARMELVDLLASKGQQQELLGELISLQAEAPDDEAMQGRLAKLFLTAGAPRRAAGVYQALIAKNPEDRDAYAGLGEAELEDGNYRDAHMAFFRAFLKSPNDASIRARLELLNTVTELDPTPRQLPTAEKYRRSLMILEMARASLEQCMAPSGTPSGEKAQLLAEADAAAANTPAARVTNELAEKALGVAEKLWRAKVKECGPAAAGEEPLRLIMEKLAA